MADPLPTAGDVLDRALAHLNEARQHISEAQSWTTAVDSPTTTRQRAAIDILRVGAADLKAQLDQLKGRCYEALGDE